MTVLLETCWIRSPPGIPPVRLPHGLPATSCKSAEDRLCVPGVGSDPSQGLAGPTFADRYFLGQPLTYSKPCDGLQHGLKLKGLLRNRAFSSCSCPPEYFLMKV